LTGTISLGKFVLHPATREKHFDLKSKQYQSSIDSKAGQ
jgi:hypothetical protein